MIFKIQQLVTSTYTVYSDSIPNTVLFENFFNIAPFKILTEFGPQNEQSTDTIRHGLKLENPNINYTDDIIFENVCDTSSKIIRSNNIIYSLTQNIQPITFAPNYPIRVYNA